VDLDILLGMTIKLSKNLESINAEGKISRKTVNDATEHYNRIIQSLYSKDHDSLSLIQHISTRQTVSTYEVQEDCKSLAITLGQLEAYLSSKIGVELLGKIIPHASFLGINRNWAYAALALQLQEIAIIHVSDQLEIKLDKENVERILGKKLKDGEIPFRDRYEAFSKEMKKSGVDLPVLTVLLRTMRNSVLHEGYNPQKEEADAIVEFTIGFLRKLEAEYTKS
jgi:hypothetical protein